MEPGSGELGDAEPLTKRGEKKENVNLRRGRQAEGKVTADEKRGGNASRVYILLTASEDGETEIRGLVLGDAQAQERDPNPKLQR